MRLPSPEELVRALADGGVRLAYASPEERERLRQAVLRAARGAGLVCYTRARGPRGLLFARAVRDAAPASAAAEPRPRPYRPADARLPSSRAFVQGGFPERAIGGARRDALAAAELAARVRLAIEQEEWAEPW